MSTPPSHDTPSGSSSSPSRSPHPEHRSRSPRRIPGNFQHPAYGPGKVLGSPHHRSDSAMSFSRSRGIASNNSSPASSEHMHGENDQDMADLTAEMALLDDDHVADSRSGRTGRVLTSPKGTGGLRPLSLSLGGKSGPKKHGHTRGLSTESFYRDDLDDVDGYEPNSKYTPIESYSSEKSMAENGNSGVIDPEALSFLKKRRRLAMWDIFIYRLRFCLRVLSLIGSGVVISTLAHLTEVYSRTKNDKDKNERLVWPLNLKLEPTNLLLGGAVVAVAISFAWMLMSVRSSVKMLIGGKMTLAAIFSTLVTLGIWIGAIVHSAVMKAARGDETTMFSVCELAKNPPPFKSISTSIDFQFHCGEINFAWSASLAIAIADSLILITVIAGWIFRWWNVGGKDENKPFWSAPPIAEVKRARSRAIGGI